MARPASNDESDLLIVGGGMVGLALALAANGAGLKVAAKMHLGAAVQNADPVVEFTEMMIHELLLVEPLELTDGFLDVPNAPGLGMQLDEDKIQAYRTPVL